MGTQEVAERLIELYNAGKSLQAEEELYADDVISKEQDGRVTTGKEAVMAKTRGLGEMTEEVFRAEATHLYVNQDTFLVTFIMDMKLKNIPRITGEEYGFYRVKDGKVVEEYFYMQPVSLAK